MPLIPVECLLSSSTIDTYHVPIYTPALQFIQNTNVYPYLHVSYVPSSYTREYFLQLGPLHRLHFPQPLSVVFWPWLFMKSTVSPFLWTFWTPSSRLFLNS